MAKKHRGGPAPTRTRADKKELARQRREEIRKRERRAQFIRTFSTLAVISGLVWLAVFWFTRPDDEPTAPDVLPGLLATRPPWPANTALLGERLDALGLPPAGETQHVHANLRIFVRGQPVTVPVDIGLDADTPASLHTHEEDGTIHVESADVRDFTLGEFFDVWGVRLSDSCIGGDCAQGGEALQAFVGGQEVTGDPREIVLDDETVIVLTYGTSEQLPDPIPSTFDFSTVAG